MLRRARARSTREKRTRVVRQWKIDKFISFLNTLGAIGTAPISTLQQLHQADDEISTMSMLWMFLDYFFSFHFSSLMRMRTRDDSARCEWDCSFTMTAYLLQRTQDARLQLYLISWFMHTLKPFRVTAKLVDLQLRLLTYARCCWWWEIFVQNQFSLLFRWIIEKRVREMVCSHARNSRTHYSFTARACVSLCGISIISNYGFNGGKLGCFNARKVFQIFFFTINFGWLLWKMLGMLFLSSRSLLTHSHDDEDDDERGEWRLLLRSGSCCCVLLCYGNMSFIIQLGNFYKFNISRGSREWIFRKFSSIKMPLLASWRKESCAVWDKKSWSIIMRWLNI